MSTATVTSQANRPPETSARFTTVHLSELEESKSNPRRHFAGLEELTASVKQHGVLTPLLVRPMGLGYEIIAGARRYRAAKAAKLDQLPVRVLHLDDAQALEFQVIENLQREDVHPLDEALGYQALLKDGKYDVPAIAAKVSKSESYVYQRLKLAALIPAAQTAFFDGKLTAGHAILVARLQAKQQKEALEQVTRYEHSVRNLAEWIHENVHLNLTEAAFPKDDASLVPSAKACTDCPKRTGANPLLFPDVKKADTCTDPGCFHAKETAFVERQIKEHPDARPLSIGYFYGKDKPKGLTDWDDAGKKKCKDTAAGIIVQIGNHYGDRGRLGQLVNICTNKRCRVHHDYVPSENRKPTPAELKKRAADEFHRKVEQALYPAVISAAAKEKSPNIDDLRVITLAMTDGVYDYRALEVLATAVGLKIDADAEFRKAVPKLTAAQLVAVCLGMVLSEADRVAERRAAAKRHGVDVKAIEKQVREAEAAAKSKVQTSTKKA